MPTTLRAPAPAARLQPLSLAAVALALAFLATAGPLAAPTRAARPEVRPPSAPAAARDRIIVKYRRGVPAGSRAELRRQERLERLRDLPLIRAEVARVSGRSVADALAALRRRADIEYAEPDQRRVASDYRDEPSFPGLWGLHNTGQSIGGVTGTPDVDVNGPEAAALSLGDPNLVVAVIDDGVDFSHPDLAGRQWVNPGESGGGKETNRIDDDRNGFVDDVNGWDFCNDDRTVHDLDQDAHGTHVAGTIAGSVNGVGVVGVAPNVKIMALKFLDDSVCGWISDEIAAIQYAASHGVRISNNSYGAPGYSQAERDAIAASGMLFVAAAGNDGFDNDTNSYRSYPASYDLGNILSVAALENRGYLPSWSNRGATSVDIAAPGAVVLSSVPRTSSAAATWKYWSGTSMATPHVTGVAALAASVDVRLRSDPLALKQLLLDTGRPAPRTAGLTLTGALVDAHAAVVAAAAGLGSDDVAPSGTIAINGGAPYARGTATLSVPASDDPGGTGVSRVRLSNDGVQWAEHPYSPTRTWSLTDPTYGGTTTNGSRTVYAQWSDWRGNWSAVKSDTVVLDTVAPRSTAPVHALVAGSALGTSTVPLRVSWSAAADVLSGVARYELQQSTNGGAWSRVALASPTTRTVTRSLAPGRSYRFQVRAFDRAGNPSAWAARPRFVLGAYSESSSTIAYRGTWSRTSVSSAFGGALKSAVARGAAARFSFTGRTVAWVAPRKATFGRANVYVDGTFATTIDLYSATGLARRAVFVRNWSSSGSHSVEVRVVGTSGRPKVAVDAFVVIR